MSLRFFLLVVILLAYSHDLHAQWVPAAGQIWSQRQMDLRSLAVHGDTIIAGTYRSGGIYRSADAGQHWTTANVGLPFSDDYPDIYCLLIHRDVVYAGMVGGLYASHDWGQSWHFVEMGLPSYAYVTQIASLHDTLFVGAPPGMLLRSTDGGISWTALSFGFSPTGDVTALAANNTTLFAGLYNGVYRSSDGGLTWSKGMLTDTMAASIPRVISLATKGDTIYAGSENGVYRSFDNGITWSPARHGLPDRFAEIDAMAVSPSAVYAEVGGWNLYVSRDWGSNWNLDTTGIPNPVLIEALVVQADMIYAGALGLSYSDTTRAYFSPGGLYILNEASHRWQPTFQYFPVRANIGWIFARGEYLFATANGFIYRSSDGGSSWQVPDSTFGPYVTSAALRSDTLYVGGWKVHYSTDNGNTWKPDTVGLPGWSVLSLLSTEDGFYAGVGAYYLNSNWGGVYHKKNGSAKWDSVGLPDRMITWLVQKDSLVFASASAITSVLGGVYATSDQGKTWIERDAGLPWFGVSTLAVQGRFLFAGAGGVYVSTDNGVTWAGSNEGLPRDTSGLYPGALSLTVSGSALLMTSPKGVYVSSDSGKHWFAMNNGLELRALSVNSLTISSGICYIGTADGIWQFPLSTLLAVKDHDMETPPVGFALDQNFPNPFNPTTTIRYALPHRSHVTLIVYNTLGQHVATLVNSDIDAGYHSVQFDGSNLASGLYLYSIRAGSFVETKKLLLVR